MIRQEKEIITQEKIKKTLKSMHRAAIPMALTSLFGSVGLTTLWTWLLLFTSTGKPVVLVVIWSLMTVMLFLLSIYFLICFIKVIVTAKSTYMKALLVVEDSLVYREETHRHYTYNFNGIFGIFDRRKLVKALYFQEHGTYFISGIDGSTYEYSSIDDKFYLVLTGRGKIALVYNQKVYEYRER
ncbi:MAG: hypothetical protein J6A83_02205 [Clostridia bacterium]|nr:hypothetical protein [Clostridia bacterium]